MSNEIKSGNKPGRVALATFIGTTLEWYDFFIYGAVAALVFNKIFFPSFDPYVGVLLSFATFAVGFIARPIGAVIFGHYGDTIGRKGVLMATMVIMGVTTMAIGILPSYETAGIAAPILLVICRFLQGVGLGGEWGGAVLMASEHSDPKRRGFFTSWTQVGVPAANLLSVGVIAGVSSWTTNEQFLAWRWRIPFLLSFLLIIVGFWIRSSLNETPEFEKMKAAKMVAKLPVLELVKTHPRQLMISCFIRVGTDVSFYVFSLFSLTYITSNLGLSRPVALTAVLIASAIQIVTIPLFATLSDRIGRSPVFMAGSIGAAVWAFPFFTLLDTKEPLLITVAVSVAMTCWALMYGPLAALISELFDARVRYSGVSVGYQLAGILGGGLAPIISIALLNTYKSSLPISIYVASTLVVATLVALVTHKAKGVSEPAAV